MSSSKTLADSDPVNERNWYKKATAAMEAHPGQWRKQFTRQELELIEREMGRECEWAFKAEVYDLPGPRRFGATVD